jgi:hypothetical protein
MEQAKTLVSDTEQELMVSVNDTLKKNAQWPTTKQCVAHII